MQYRLVIFDADGTLCDRDSGALLPGVEDWFNLNRGARFRGRHVATAIVTNQGGPACHDAGWSHSGQFPSLAEVEARYNGLALRLGAKLYMSLAYVTKGGQVLLPQGVRPDSQRACLDWRKPQPGMLLAAMRDARARPAETLMIGDRPEDQAAAAAAGCYFQWAQKFFARGWEPGRDYGLVGAR